MPKPMPTADQAAKSWASGFGGSAQKWQDGVNAVTSPPGVAAAAASDRYMAGVQASLPKYQANVAKVTLGEWKNACVTKGAGRFMSGAQVGQAKYQAKIAPVLSAIGQIRDGLPPRGDINANIQRMTQMAMGLHQRAQQGF